MTEQERQREYEYSLEDDAMDELKEKLVCELWTMFFGEAEFD